jgi:hypothetical protein
MDALVLHIPGEPSDLTLDESSTWQTCGCDKLFHRTLYPTTWNRGSYLAGPVMHLRRGAILSFELISRELQKAGFAAKFNPSQTSETRAHPDYTAAG